ncbi:MAG: TRAM domain-containing protein, partial [Lachnospiraceae bacterium]|nr:TRAM domain-containing protein [Lachnospiraceae bacterium]
MNKNDEIEVKITDLTDEGFGIGHTGDGYALFVKGALPGDKVVAHVTKVMKRYSYAIVSEFIERSKDRVDPVCVVCGKCGGCTLQELSYEAQLDFKKRKVEAALTRTGGFTGFSVPLPVSGSPEHYRNKAEIPVGVNKDGETVAGYYAIHSHRIVPCDDCIIAPMDTDRIKRDVLIYMKENGISAYDSETRKGSVRHI